MSDVEKLIEALKLVDETGADLPSFKDGNLTILGVRSGDQPELIDEIETLACGAFITGNGCNWANMRPVEDAGFAVVALEKDSFGWLVGGIKTKHGTIVYG